MPREMLDLIFEQAQREYPHECCGMILGPSDRPGLFSRVRPCRNVQNEYHKLDPENFPRTAETAYFIAPEELLKIQKEIRKSGESIRLIYHSHINAGAYFSEEDKRVATSEGEPAYPGVDYLVVSLKEGKVRDCNIFRWDEKRREFIL